MLSWSAIIPTLNRGAILERSLPTIVAQTRPPKQIIVVDASDEWELSKTRILNSLALTAKSIELIYVGSDKKSLTYQQNVGLSFCDSDVVFYLDDDSFMYIDCAEEIMKIYEQDEGHLVGGVMALMVPQPPSTSKNDQKNSQSDNPVQTNKQPDKLNLWARFLKPFHKLWHIQNLFIPYDGTYHRYDISELAKKTAINNVVLFHGCRMTFRTSALKEIGGFEELISRTVNDLDVSYRVSRTSALVLARRAKLFHEQTAVSRIHRYKNSVLVILNPIALFLAHRTVKHGVNILVVRFALSRALLEFLRDCANPNRGFPHARGAWLALRLVPKLMQMDKQQLREWYPRFQAELLNKENDSKLFSKLLIFS